MTNEQIAERIGCEGVTWNLYDKGREIGVRANWGRGVHNAERFLKESETGPPTETDFERAIAYMKDWKRKRDERAAERG